MGTEIVLAATSYTKAITQLKSVLLTLGSAIGAVMLVYGGMPLDCLLYLVYVNYKIFNYLPPTP